MKHGNSIEIFENSPNISL